MVKKCLAHLPSSRARDAQTETKEEFIRANFGLMTLQTKMPGKVLYDTLNPNQAIFYPKIPS